MPYVDGKYMSKREWLAKFGRLDTLASRVDPKQEDEPAPAEAAPVQKPTRKGATKAIAKATGKRLPDGITEVPGGTPVKPAEADTVSAHINDSDPVEVDDNGIPLA